MRRRPCFAPGVAAVGAMRRPRPMQAPHCCAVSPGAPDSRPAPLLRLQDIYYRVPMDYENVVFDVLNFEVHRGELVIVTGQNGSGKSTALHLMLGLKEAERGKLFWKGKETKRKRLIENIGVVMQSPGDYFFLPTVLEELVMNRPSRTPDDVRRVMHATGLSNVSLLADPRSLSGGQTRRLALASQMMREPLPELFVLDEPLVGVDWTGRDELIELLGSLKSKFAMVIISHEPAELLPFADRVVQVARGRMHEVQRDVIDRALRIRAERAEGHRSKVQTNKRKEAGDSINLSG